MSVGYLLRTSLLIQDSLGYRIYDLSYKPKLETRHPVDGSFRSKFQADFTQIGSRSAEL